MKHEDMARYGAGLLTTPSLEAALSEAAHCSSFPGKHSPGPLSSKAQGPDTDRGMPAPVCTQPAVLPLRI